MAKLKSETEKWKVAVKTLLEGNLLTQKELSLKCGVSAQTVSNWLNDVRNPGVIAKRKLLQIIHESKGKMKENRDILHLVAPGTNHGGDRDKLAKLLSNMTDEQCKKLLKMAEKSIS